MNSKQKGARGEREVAAILQAWWRQLEPDAKFYRTPGSGAWATSHKTEGFKVRGDILVDPPTCKRFPFSVEVKFRKTITPRAIENFEMGRRSSITKYWNQCVEGATHDNLRPLLVFRGNRMEWHAALEEDGERHVCELSEITCLDPLVFAKA